MFKTVPPTSVARAAGLLLAAAACAAPALAATAPATDQIWRSIETPYPAPGPFHPAYSAWMSFQTSASLDHGLTVSTVNLGAAPLGSFSHQALTLPVFNTSITASLSPADSDFAHVQSGADPIAFVDFGSQNRYVHVGTQVPNPGELPADQRLLTLQFSAPVQGFAFLGAGISDVGFVTAPYQALSQRIQLDDRPWLDILNVDPNTVQTPMHMSMGILAAQPFSRVTFWLPAEHRFDNAALANLTIAFDPNALPVPEPATWALWLAGLATVSRLAQRRRSH